MADLLLVAIVLTATIVIFLLGRATGASAAGAKNRAPRPSGQGSTSPLSPSEGELVAIIAAAVSEASGMQMGSFKISSISPSGFNTPIWGHIDRLYRGE